MDFQRSLQRFLWGVTSDHFGGEDRPLRMARQLLEREPTLARANVYTALVLGDVETVRRRVEQEPDWVRSKDGPLFDREPLLYTAFSKLHRDSPERAEGLLATARLLLDAGADPNAGFIVEPWNDSPLRPLYGACGVASFPEMAELLLDRGALLNDGESLYHSLESPDLRCFELLLARGVEPKGTNALFHAFDLPGLERTRRLLEQGADPNEVLDQHEGTALHVAIQKGRERELVEMLVEHGADVNARRPDGRTPYQVALQHGQNEIADYLAGLGAGTEETPYERFMAACSRGDLEAARRVVAETPRLFETLSWMDSRAFLRIAEQGRTALLAAVVDCGFPVNLEGMLRQTALHWACFRGWSETVEALLARGAAIEAREDEHRSKPLGWAVYGWKTMPNREGDYPGTIRRLLAAGASASEISVEGLDELDPEVADLLRAAGAREQDES